MDCFRSFVGEGSEFMVLVPKCSKNLLNPSHACTYSNRAGCVISMKLLLSKPYLGHSTTQPLDPFLQVKLQTELSFFVRSGVQP